MKTGEFELIARFVERLPAPGPDILIASGDDAAVAGHDGPVVVSVDAVVEGIHFERPAFSMSSVGSKALASAISDLAAMGAAPRHGYVVAGIPDDLPEDEVLQLADGIARVSEDQGMAIIGGDLVRSPTLMVSVTAIGSELEGVPLVSRAGALEGDSVVVTGSVGGAAAGLRLLADGAGAGTDQELLARQFDPTPRVRAGQSLAEHGAGAMIDLSDGLVADAAHLARASGKRIEIELDAVPFQEGALEVLSDHPREARIAAASGGEDYELLACIAPDRVEIVRDELAGDCELTVIGSVSEGEGAELIDGDGTPVPTSGFDHFSGS